MSMKMKHVPLLGMVLSLAILGCSDQNSRVTTKFNEDASLVGSLPMNPLQGRVITSWIDKRASTMSTLYGNDSAVQYARAHFQHDYPSGSIVTLVTWNQKEDDRWFGGRIPTKPKAVEFVKVGGASDGRPWYVYQKFEGEPLQKTSSQEGPVPNERALYLLSQRAAVMP
jgi:hypothetical protein